MENNKSVNRVFVSNALILHDYLDDCPLNKPLTSDQQSFLKNAFKDLGKMQQDATKADKAVYDLLGQRVENYPKPAYQHICNLPSYISDLAAYITNLARYILNLVRSFLFNDKKPQPLNLFDLSKKQELLELLEKTPKEGRRIFLKYLIYLSVHEVDLKTRASFEIKDVIKTPDLCHLV
jgi:hypothetical protein